MPAPYYFLATMEEGKDRRKAANNWRQFIEAVRRDRNRAFWIPFAEERIAALGFSP
jgi:hypothetical protein